MAASRFSLISLHENVAVLYCPPEISSFFLIKNFFFWCDFGLNLKMFDEP